MLGKKYPYQIIATALCLDTYKNSTAQSPSLLQLELEQVLKGVHI